MDICPKCGLPRQACVCEEIAKGLQHIKVSIVKRRYGKISTIVTGFDKGIDLRSIAKSLKNELACGGTSKENEIELQGNHLKKVKPLLIKLGFDESSIED
jgi:translation initiation factor 1